MNINRVFQYSIVIINFDPFGDTSYRRKQNIKLGILNLVLAAFIFWFNENLMSQKNTYSELYDTKSCEIAQLG